MKIIDPKNVKVDGPGPVQIGDAKKQLLVKKTDSEEVQIGLVQFAPKSRTKWHTHDGDQILIFTEGKGIVANKNEEHVMTPGMIAIVGKDENHWHGATETTSCAHLAISTPHGTTILE